MFKAILCLYSLAIFRCYSCGWQFCSRSPSKTDDDGGVEGSSSSTTGNSSGLHSLQRKLCTVAQANTSSTCVAYGNGGTILKIENHGIKIPNNLSTTFLKKA